MANRLTNILRSTAAAAAGALAYIAGKRDRTDADWWPRNTGPNAMADETLDQVRARVSYLIDNDEHFRNAARIIANNVCGTVPEPATPSADLNDWLEKEFRLFASAVDPARTMSLVDSQDLFIKEMFRYGEVLRVEAIAPPIGTQPAGPSVELVCALRIPLDLGGGAGSSAYIERRAPNGNVVRQGVELDAYQRPVAYWVLREHPGDTSLGGMGLGWQNFDNCTRVPVDRAQLCFTAWKAGQNRGVPEGVSAVLTKRREGRFNNASMLQAEAAASIGLFFTGADSDTIVPAVQKEKGSQANAPARDGNGMAITRILPGLVGFLKKGVEPKLLQANLPGPGFAPTTEVLLRRIAAGLGVSYSVLARDYTRANFSATRAESLEDRKGYSKLQQMVWEKHTRPLYRLWLRWMIAAGKIPASITAEVEQAEQGSARVIELWTPRLAEIYAREPEMILAAEPIHGGWEWVNPLQEAKATETELSIGAISPQMVCAGKGRRLTDVFRQRLNAEIKWNAMRAELGLPPAPMPGSVVASAAPGGGGGGGVDTQIVDQSGQDPQQPGDVVDPAEAA
jgi:lambda family phage portal protein